MNDKLTLSRQEWQTLVLAVLLSRIVLYFIGYVMSGQMGLIDPAEVSLTDAACRFDCIWSTRIMEHGYDPVPRWLSGHNAASWAFMPVTPLLGSAMNLLTGDAKLALILVSNITFALSVPVLLLALKQAGLKEETRLTMIWLVCFSPFTVYGMAGYSEPLFIALVAGVFLFAARQQWLWVALLGMIAAVTRNLGVMLVFSVVIIAFEHYRWQGIKTLQTGVLKAWAAVWVIPLGFFCYMFYLYWLTGDALAFGHIQIAWGRTLTHPLNWIEYGFEKGGVKLYLTLMALAGFALNAWLMARRRYAEAVFMFINLYLPFSSGVNAMPRYLFGLYPTYLAIALLVERYPRIKTPLLCLFGLGCTLITMGFFSRQFFTV